MVKYVAGAQPACDHGAQLQDLPPFQMVAVTHKSKLRFQDLARGRGFAKSLKKYADDIFQSLFICFCISKVGRPECPAFSTYCCDTTPPL